MSNTDDDISAWEKRFLKDLRYGSKELRLYTGFGFTSSFLDLLAIYVGGFYVIPSDPLGALLGGLGNDSKSVIYIFLTVVLKNALWTYYLKQQMVPMNTGGHATGYNPNAKTHYAPGPCIGGKC